jgi:alanyl-tRNA synthetase
MDADAIRSAFFALMESTGHERIQRSSLIPSDPTTLFTGSGMQALLPHLLGEPDPRGTRLTDSQPCLRSQDIDEVGDNRHTTFFEMLGNWSLGDYFKKHQIQTFFLFLTDIVGLDPLRLYVTCFIGDRGSNLPRDDEAASIWKEAFASKGIDAGIAEIGSAAAGDMRGIADGERIFFYDSNENWWSRGGNLSSTPVGDPCGPDSEVFYDFGPEHHDATYGLPHPASDGGRFLEIGNQVFMQYQREEDGTFSPLKKKNVDFGGGLERITAAAQGVPDVYRGSLLAPLIRIVEDLSHTSYANNPGPMRIIVDHLRGAYFLAVDGVRPGNKAQGYVMRRLIRRAITTAKTIGLRGQFFAPLVAQLGIIYADAYPETATRGNAVLDSLLREERAFHRTLDSGLRALRQFEGGTLTGEDIFTLSDTFGFPQEVTIEESSRLGIAVSKGWETYYQRRLIEQKERSRGSSNLGANTTPS